MSSDSTTSPVAGGLAATPPPPTPGSTPGARYVERGVCPFECCVYGEWMAIGPVRVHETEGDRSAVVFEIAPRDTFTALTGSVHLDPVGLAVVHDTVPIGAPGGDAMTLLPGDTVEILAPVGEGYFHVRVGDRIVEAPGFWSSYSPGTVEPAGTLLREPEWSWWVQVEDHLGRIGWVDMEAQGESIWGADACGGPPPV